jgi:hypothetical protein
MWPKWTPLKALRMIPTVIWVTPRMMESFILREL